MIRFFIKHILRFVAAIVLLALSLCAVEVALRAQKLKSSVCPVNPSDGAALVCMAPSPITFLDVPPLINVAHPSGQGSVHFSSNSWGLRGKEVTVPKPRGTYRVLCLGNGETLAPEIQESATFVSGIQARLQSSSSLPIEVLNAGCPDSGPCINMLRAQRLLGLQPDLIVFVLAPEDIHHDVEARRFLRLDDEGHPSYACHPALRPGEGLIEEVCKEFYTAEWLAEKTGQKILSRATPVSGQNRTNSLSKEFDERLVEMPFTQTAQLAERIYARFLIVVYPTPWDLANEKNRTQTDLNSPHVLLQQVAMSKSLLMCDLFTDFQQAPNLRSLYSSETGRLTEEGHALVADKVSQFIINQISGSWGTTTEPQSRPVPNLGNWPPATGGL